MLKVWFGFNVLLYTRGWFHSIPDNGANLFFPGVFISAVHTKHASLLWNTAGSPRGVSILGHSHLGETQFMRPARAQVYLLIHLVPALGPIWASHIQVGPLFKGASSRDLHAEAKLILTKRGLKSLFVRLWVWVASKKPSQSYHAWIDLRFNPLLQRKWSWNCTLTTF